jgi:hypothetical protein
MVIGNDDEEKLKSGYKQKIDELKREINVLMKEINYIDLQITRNCIAKNGRHKYINQSCYGDQWFICKYCKHEK